MDSFIAAAGESSFAGLLVVFALAVIAPITGWSQGGVTRALAVVLAIAVAQGSRAQWDIPATYAYGVAGAGAWLLSTIAAYASKKQAASAGA